MAQKREHGPSVKTEKTQFERDREPVTGVFRYYDVPGGDFTFVYKKNPGDQIEKYELKDGETYTLPRGVAEHLNQNCWYPEHEYLQDDKGRPSERIGRKVQRVAFTSLDYTGKSDHETIIYTAEKVL